MLLLLAGGEGGVHLVSLLLFRQGMWVGCLRGGGRGGEGRRGGVDDRVFGGGREKVEDGGQEGVVVFEFRDAGFAVGGGGGRGGAGEGGEVEVDDAGFGVVGYGEGPSFTRISI